MADATDAAPRQQAQAQSGASFPLLAYLDGLIGDLRGQVPAALGRWDAEAIHRSRVATRRMKAALDLLRPVLGRRGRRRFARITRNLRRRLGPLRDADVMIDHLRELGGEGKPPRAIEWLSERLCGERDQLRVNAAKRRPPEAVLQKLAAWEPVRAEIADAHEAVDALLAESLHLQLDAFAEQAGRLVSPPDAADARQDPHELRIAGKALRYTLEMAAEQGHELPDSLTRTFKRMQDALGLWHDYVVLAERATHAALDEQLAHHQPELMTELLGVVGDALGRSTQQLGEFKRQWAEEGDAVATAIRTGFPLTRPAPAPAVPGGGGGGDGHPGPEGTSGPQTGPGLRGSGSPASPQGCPPAAAGGA